jgi:hypothetical protein
MLLTDGLGKIVLWGHAENGIGMLVGNLATLRPMFRRMFNLGGSDKSNTPVVGRASAGSAFPNAFRRTYKSFNTSYELGTANTDANSRDPNIITQIYWGDREHSSVASDSESGSALLQDVDKLFQVQEEFFKLPVEEKQRYDLKDKGSYFG